MPLSLSSGGGTAPCPTQTPGRAVHRAELASNGLFPSLLGFTRLC